ncbi:hypothetical protein D9M70_610180 [compost metagenome]
MQSQNRAFSKGGLEVSAAALGAAVSAASSALDVVAEMLTSGFLRAIRELKEQALAFVKGEEKVRK